MAQKVRLDNLLVKLGKFKSREAAKEAILSGLVSVDGFPCDKVARQVSLESKISVDLSEGETFVSRGGIKLNHALLTFGVDPNGKIILDAGISTGGFTDCLLKRGAKLVVGVDVGYGQLDWGLRLDPRLLLFERTNIKDLTRNEIKERFDLVVADLSFISLTKVFESLKGLAKPAADFILLVKPQFEVGKRDVGKGGIVRDPSLHERVLIDLYNYFSLTDGKVLGVTESPIKGNRGNREFFMHVSLKGSGLGLKEFEEEAHKIVFEAGEIDQKDSIREIN